MPHIPVSFRLQMLILAGINLLLSAFFEIFVVDYLVFYKFTKTKLYRRLDSYRPTYEHLRFQTSDLKWLLNACISNQTIPSNTLVNSVDFHSTSEHNDNLRSGNNDDHVGSIAEQYVVLNGHSSTAMLITEPGS